MIHEQSLRTKLSNPNPTKISFNKKIILVKLFLLVSFLFNLSVLSIAQQKTLGLTLNKPGSTQTGYVLFSPMGSKTTYLVDKCGKKVHSWKSAHPPGLSVYLLPDGNLLRTGITQDTFYVASGKGGIIEKIDWSGKVVWSYVIANDSLGQHHDIYPMENGNILVIAWHGIPAAEAINKGRFKSSINGSKLWSERILEIQPVGTNDAKVVWQWSLWDHIIQDESISKPDFNIISNHPELMNINFAPLAGSDWIHMNAVSYNKTLDQVILSCHNNSEIWIIDHSTTTKEAASHSGGISNKGGDILYRWGNPQAYNKGGKSSQKFFRQHNAYWIPNHYADGGDIMVFNNGLGRTPEYSTVEIISPPVSSPGVYNPGLPFGPTNQKWIYKDSIPTNFYSPVISGAQRMPNGNTMICSGNPGKLFEITPQNKVVWQYINPVSADDDILYDGQSASGNSVFRCVYYADTFSAFIGKDLSQKGTVEKNSYSYSCSFRPLDKTPPTLLSLVPNTKSKNIDLNTQLFIAFDEVLLKGNANIKLFGNNTLIETIPVSDNRVMLMNKTVMITPLNDFDASSRISIIVEKGCFTDSAGNPSPQIDSISWYFNTVTKTQIKNTIPVQLTIYPNPVVSLMHIPYATSTPDLRILSSDGKEMPFNVKNDSEGVLVIDISQLSSGVYSLFLNGKYRQIIAKK
jgi:hypothetical protein